MSQGFRTRAGDRGRRRRYVQKRRPQDDGEFLWLVSLSDLMILLFIFFVVLFAFTRGKLKESDLLRIVATLRNDKQMDPMEQTKANLERWVDENKLKDQINISRTPDGGVEVMIKDQLLFESGDFAATPKGTDLMRLLAQTLERVPKSNSIGIEGHTDDVPIHTRDIQDNWELSAKRAWAVLHALDLSPELQKRTVIMGYGDSRPLVPNRDPQGKAIEENQIKNRRVTVHIF